MSWAGEVLKELNSFNSEVLQINVIDPWLLQPTEVQWLTSLYWVSLLIKHLRPDRYLHTLLLTHCLFQMHLPLIKWVSIVSLARFKNFFWHEKWNIDSFLQSRNSLTHGTCKIFMALHCPRLCLHHFIEHAFYCTHQKNREHLKAAFVSASSALMAAETLRLRPHVTGSGLEGENHVKPF